VDGDALHQRRFRAAHHEVRLPPGGGLFSRRGPAGGCAGTAAVGRPGLQRTRSLSCSRQQLVDASSVASVDRGHLWRCLCAPATPGTRCAAAQQPAHTSSSCSSSQPAPLAAHPRQLRGPTCPIRRHRGWRRWPSPQSCARCSRGWSTCTSRVASTGTSRWAPAAVGRFCSQRVEACRAASSQGSRTGRAAALVHRTCLAPPRSQAHTSHPPMPARPVPGPCTWGPCNSAL
jgi:hypothetical protein